MAFAPKAGTAEGHSASVIAIAFLCAVPIRQGTSFIKAMGGKPDTIHDLRQSDFVWMVSREVVTILITTYRPMKQRSGRISFARNRSLRTLEKTAYAAYMDRPNRYLYRTLVQTRPVSVRKGLTEGAGAAGAQIVHTTETAESSHSPFLSTFERTSEFIRKVAGD